MHYDDRKDVFLIFNDMIKSVYLIEDVVIKKGEIVLKKDKTNGN